MLGTVQLMGPNKVSSMGVTAFFLSRPEDNWTIQVNSERTTSILTALIIANL
jgi:hypothetical protein